MMCKNRIQSGIKYFIVIITLLVGCEYVPPDEPYEDVDYPPYPPSDPYPQDGAINQPLNLVLGWSARDADNDIMDFNVYLDDDSHPYNHMVSKEQTGMYYDTGMLRSNTTYYWQVEVRDSTWSNRYSEVWSFTTISNDSMIEEDLTPRQ